VLSFNDRTKPPQGLPPAIADTYPLALEFRIYRPALHHDMDLVSVSQAVGASVRYKPAQLTGEPNRWRDLAVGVTPARVRTFWDGQLVSEVTADELSALARSLQASRPELAGLDIDFRPNGGFGLFIQDGAASFKDVVLEAPGSAK
jgi:hypothetical protein